MVLETILMSLGEIILTVSPGQDLAVIPQMELQDALFTKEGYQVSFSGSIDYCVVECEKDKNGDNQGILLR